MSIVGFVLRRPYTVAAVLILICLLGIGAARRMPVDIFPEIDIPVVSVVWIYNGMRAKGIQNQILSAGPASVSRRTSPLADRSTGARRASPPKLAIRIADQDDAMAASRMQTVSMNEQVAGPE
jgi:AcrB/AcrD/AcrF family